jgi:hypothetical protein
MPHPSSKEISEEDEHIHPNVAQWGPINLCFLFWEPQRDIADKLQFKVNIHFDKVKTTKDRIGEVKYLAINRLVHDCVKWVCVKVKPVFNLHSATTLLFTRMEDKTQLWYHTCKLHHVHHSKCNPDENVLVQLGMPCPFHVQTIKRLTILLLKIEPNRQLQNGSYRTEKWITKFFLCSRDKNWIPCPFKAATRRPKTLSCFCFTGHHKNIYPEIWLINWEGFNRQGPNWHNHIQNTSALYFLVFGTENSWWNSEVEEINEQKKTHR